MHLAAGELEKHYAVSVDIFMNITPHSPSTR